LLAYNSGDGAEDYVFDQAIHYDLPERVNERRECKDAGRLQNERSRPVVLYAEVNQKTLLLLGR